LMNQMKKTIIFAAMTAALLLSSCSKKKQTDDIIATKYIPKKPLPPIAMKVDKQSQTVNWLGKKYVVDIVRTPVDSLPRVSDDTGQEYIDNSIHLAVKRDDGSVFFEKKFTKNAFESFIDKEYFEHSVLLGMVFNGTEGGEVRFLGSVGSPDDLAEEYVPFNVFISKMGEVRIEKAVIDIPGNDSTLVDANEGV